MNRWINLFLWVNLIIWISIWNMWQFFGKEVFEVGQSSVIFGFASAIFLIYPQKIITRISLTIALNQLLDEIFFNPFEISWNEYTTIGVAILLIFAKFFKFRITKKKLK